MEEGQHRFMEEAITLSAQGVKDGHGGPFGCIVVKGGNIIGRGWNQVLLKDDPTAHAEIVAIRDACKHLGIFQLTDCDIYASCEPCPMCLGAIYWARPARVFYANTRKDAADIGFDDSFIYEQIQLCDASKAIPFFRMKNEHALEVFKEWVTGNNRNKLY